MTTLCNTPFTHLRIPTFAILLTSILAATADAPDSLLWKREPGGDWNRSDIRTLGDIAGWETPEESEARSRFGGWLAGRLDDGTGHFRVENVDGVWWFVDPLGYRYYSVGLTSVRPAEGWDAGDWAPGAAATMTGLGFNAIGRWSALNALNQVPARIPYTTSLSFMESFGRKLGLTESGYGHARYAHNTIPVFHPDFAAHCDALARMEVGPLADDPYVLGHFTDNALPMPKDALQVALAIDPDNVPALCHSHKSAWEWLRERHGLDATAANVTDDDNRAFLCFVMARYYETTTTAIKRHAPDHLNLGSRLHGAGIYMEPVIEAANRHLDVISINYYNVWRPAPHHLERWREHAPDTPFLVTEFYVKGEDAGMDNRRGAGWIVPTQRDRGLWYQNFTLSLLEAPHCVGWHYFKYQDAPGDANKGILDQHGAPFGDFIEWMKPIHAHIYGLRSHLVASSAASP